MKKEPRADYVRGELGKVISLVRDFMERMSIDANNQMQFQYFNKDVSLGAEGISVYLLRPGSNKFETIYYVILSTEKKQDGRIVYYNTQMVLERISADMETAKAAGAKIIMIEAILDNSDGCAVQYRCGTSLFMLWKFAKENNIVYDKSINPSGHGKSEIDGEGANLKEKNKRGLCSNVTSQPECYEEGKNTIIYVDMDKDGNRIDFADVAAKYLNNETLTGRVPANNPRSVPSESDKKIASRLALVCNNGD